MHGRDKRHAPGDRAGSALHILRNHKFLRNGSDASKASAAIVGAVCGSGRRFPRQVRWIDRRDSAEFQKSSGTRPFLGFIVRKNEPEEVEHVTE